jgi:hypothetical protein
MELKISKLFSQDTMTVQYPRLVEFNFLNIYTIIWGTR